ARPGRDPGTVLTAEFGRAGQGLGAGAPVKIRGVTVGSVADVAPDGYIAWATDETAPDRRAAEIRDALGHWCGPPADRAVHEPRRIGSVPGDGKEQRS
ncbi:MlaD family protein, partial [Actinomadura geliboluensis]